MKILVTGGAGYVGTRLVQRLLQLGHRVNVLDTMVYGNQIKNSWPGQLEIFQGDIRDTGAVKRSLEDVEVVYHLAAISNDPTGNLNPKITIDVNKEGTEHLLKECKKAKIRQFIYASSSSGFGIQEGENITENFVPKPLTVYSETKLESEQLVLKQEDFCVTAIRPATICGVSPRQRFDLVVNALCGSAFFDKQITVYGGEQRRPNLTMADMVEIYVLLLKAPIDLVHQQVFNAGWENSTIKELAKKVTQKFGLPIVTKPSSDNRDYHICSRKIERVLGYVPVSTIDIAIAELKEAMSYGFFEHYKSPMYNNIVMLKSKL